MKLKHALLGALIALSFSANAAAPVWFNGDVEAEFKSLCETRHTLHQMPELGNQETKTQAFIIDYLKKVGVDKVIKGYKSSKTAVIGIINPDKADTVGLRSDIDALPLKENTGLSYASTAKGFMHGKETSTAHMCGHDAHMSMLLTAAKILAKHKNEIPRRIVLVFQPAEEGNSLENPLVVPNPKNSGAKALVADGLIEEFDIKRMFGMHVDGAGKPGSLELVKGNAFNSGDMFEINIHGKQAHGAMPWMSVDPALIAAETVLSLQQIASRNVNPNKGMGIVTVGKIQVGNTFNVIPRDGHLLGTVRTNSKDLQNMILKRIPEVASHVAQAYGGTADARIVNLYPVLVNDPKLSERTYANMKDFGVDVMWSTRNPGASEDFAYYTDKVPCVFFMINVGKEGVKPTFPHSDRFVVNDEALKSGVKAHIAAAFGDYKNL